MNDVVNRLVVTIIAGFFVTAIGLIVKREIKILELFKLTQVLRSQIHYIWNEPRRIRAEIPINADDLKPFARYLGALEFVVLMQISALVARYYELSQKITILMPRSAYRFTRVTGDLSDSKMDEYQAIEEELSALRYEIKVIIESVSGDQFLSGLADTPRNEFRLRSVLPIKIKLWSVGNLKRSLIYGDIHVNRSDIHPLIFKKEDNILQLFSGE